MERSHPATLQPRPSNAERVGNYVESKLKGSAWEELMPRVISILKAKWWAEEDFANPRERARLVAALKEPYECLVTNKTMPYGLEYLTRETAQFRGQLKRLRAHSWAHGRT
jgi:hypothetical protein